MIYYRTLSQQPDFSIEPQGGVILGRQDVSISQAAETYSRWTGFNRKAQNFEFQLRGPTEIRAMREHFLHHKGSWKPFYIPSWTRDFKVVGSVTEGEYTVVIDKDLTTLLAVGDRPDTFGRTLFFLSPSRSLHIARVLSITEINAESWTVNLDRQFPWTANLSRGLAGFAWFAQCATDDYDWRHITPDRCGVRIGFVEGRNAQNKTGEYSLSGETLNGSEPFITIKEEALDPIQSNMRIATAKGPNNYSTAQGANFTRQWSAELVQSDVMLSNNGATPFASAIYDGDNLTEQITFAFDVLGDEAIAWQRDFETVRICWFNSGIATSININGRTPVLFQNWTINGAITGGEADIVLYYAKTESSKIYARYQRDNFGVEYQITQSPVMPLGLIGNNTSDGIHELQAISVAHTRLTFFSGKYQEPPLNIGDAISSSVDISAEYESLTIILDPILESITGSIEVTATYESIIIELEAVESGAANGGVIDAGQIEIKGEYESIVEGVILGESIESSISIGGTFVFIVQEVDFNDTVSSKVEISGEYTAE